MATTKKLLEIVDKGEITDRQEQQVAFKSRPYHTTNCSQKGWRIALGVGKHSEVEEYSTPTTKLLVNIQE